MSSSTPVDQGDQTDARNGTPARAKRGPPYIQEISKDRRFGCSGTLRCADRGHNGPVKILLVEDDRSIAASLRDALTAASYDVTHVTTGADALAAGEHDMVLLDLGLPDMDGRDVCRTLRSRTTTPIIMLTARGEEFDRVLGLELGADDYVTKPFSLRELLARIRAVSRRTGESDASVGNEQPTVQEVGPLVIDRRTRRVRLDGTELSLTAKEFDLLAFLADDAGAVRTRTEILESVWDAHWYGPTKTVDAHVAFLRKKLGDRRWIEAIRGVGFRLEPPA
jgi:DNA-binding response OmpR family regulator